MAPSTVNLYLPADNLEIGSHIVRPEIRVSWTGGTGPFDVEYTWDDDATFNNGNGRRIQQTNTSVTSPNTEVPLSDLGLLTNGTVWYLRARVIDQGDAGASLSDTATFTYRETYHWNRYLYALANRGVAYAFYSEPNERQVISIDATGGTFTMSFSGQGPSSSVGYDDTAANIKSALEGLSNITTVNVEKMSAQRWEVEFVDVSPSPIPAITLGTGSLTGGGATGAVYVAVDDQDPWGTTEGGTVGTDGDPKSFFEFAYLNANVIPGHHYYRTPLETQIISVDATGGTFTLTFNGVGPTGTLAYNAAASAVKTALEGLANITTVSVTQVWGRSQAWEVTFIDVSPDPIPALVINTGGLTGGGATGNVRVAVDDTDPWGTSIGGSLGADGNILTQPQTLYLQASVTPGFDPTHRPPLGWNGNTGLTTQGPGDGYLIDQPRTLYLQANVDATQPCPYVFSLSQTTIKQGQSLIVSGQGLVSDTSPTADAYGAEVRLYESPSFAAAYVALAITSWTAGSTLDTITATVPGGATSGYVAVVHTVTPSCSGSNFKALTVVALEPDRDAGWWIEVWDLRNNTAIVRPLPNVYEAEFEAVRNDIGRGSITLPADHPDLAEIIDRDASPPVQRLVKIYLHGRMAYSFIPVDKSDPWESDGAARVRIYGPGQESILRWARALWADYPAIPSSSSTWIHGSTDNAVPGGDMEPLSAFENGDAEDAIVTPWYGIGTATLYAGTTEPRSGAYSLEVTPAALNDGAAIEFQVQHDFRVYVDAYVKDPTASGDDITVDVVDSDGSTVLATTTLTPSTAAWYKATLNYVPNAGGTGNTETNTLRIRYTDGVGTPHLFYVDDAAAYTVPDLELNLSRCTAGLDRTYVGAGLHSLKYNINSGANNTFNGSVTTFPVTPNQDYTMTLNVTGPVGEDMRVGLRLGGVLDQTVHTFAGLGTWELITLTGTAGPNDETGRFAISGLESAATSFYVDEIKVTPGDPAATAGDLVSKVLTAAQARNTLTFVQTDFDASVDSNANPWPETLAFDIQPEWDLWDMLEKLVGYGYELEFAPTNWRAGGDSGWTLRLFAPLGLGSDWSTAPDGPAILPAVNLETVDPSSAPPIATVVFAEGADGYWSVAASDASIITALERREEFVRNRTGGDSATLFRTATHRLGVATTRGSQHTVGLIGDADPLPYFDFLIADRLRAHIPKVDRDLIPDATYVVAAITAALGANPELRFAVDLGNYRVTADRARELLLNRLLSRESTENYRPGTGSVRELGS